MPVEVYHAYIDTIPPTQVFDSEKFAKKREKSGKRGKKSGKEGKKSGKGENQEEKAKIGMAVSLCLS